MGWQPAIGMLLQTVIQGISLDPLGMLQQTIGEMGLRSCVFLLLKQAEEKSH